ncbi:hypothetical protein AB833_07720 [Chromatiales bacterium (ex Bugula neritina AB1)]|nr:hypothetical protein AB833_07720 [Chromatiales bacterium (ex Bugula neritina AB1)]
MIATNPDWSALHTFVENISSDDQTPCYVYNDELQRLRVNQLHTLFSDQFSLSYAVKANPNPKILGTFNELIKHFDASSIGEVRLAISAGAAPENITFTGPAKKKSEIRQAIELGIGALVIESAREADLAAALCRTLNRTQNILVRINPANTPKLFSAKMAGKHSQFGVDEKNLETNLGSILAHKELTLDGFHIYSGTNCLAVDALVENFQSMLESFKKASQWANINPRRLIFGSGFGVPYFSGETELHILTAAKQINALIDQFTAGQNFRHTRCILELGRWLIAPCGVLLTSVVSKKSTEDVEFRICDAGFNNHLAACGLMGTVIRRNWAIENLSSSTGTKKLFTLVGPLCTSIDLIAQGIELPDTNIGDVLAIPMSGAYGYSASPLNFISHPPPTEYLIRNNTMHNITTTHS